MDYQAIKDAAEAELLALVTNQTPASMANSSGRSSTSKTPEQLQRTIDWCDQKLAEADRDDRGITYVDT